MINGFVVPDEMIKAARTAFHDVRLREASSRRAVREWETEAWRCAIEAAWNRRAPSVTREEIARLLCSRHAGGCVCASEDRSSTCPSRLDDVDAILALFGGE